MTIVSAWAPSAHAKIPNAPNAIHARVLVIESAPTLMIIPQKERTSQGAGRHAQARALKGRLPPVFGQGLRVFQRALEKARRELGERPRARGVFGMAVFQKIERPPADVAPRARLPADLAIDAD